MSKRTATPAGFERAFANARLASCCLLLASCANIDERVAVPLASAEQVHAERTYRQEAMFDLLRRQDERVASVAFRLATANADLCRRTANLSGLVIHDLGQYDRAYRPFVSSYFRLAALPAVMAVVPEGPAAQAGIQPGDEIVSIAGSPLPPANVSGGASFEGVAAVYRRLTEAATSGPFPIVIERNGIQRTVSIAPVRGCAVLAQLVPSSELNAAADDKTVSVTSAMVRYARSDDELAAVMAHEFAHVVLDHKDRLNRAGFARALLGSLGSTSTSMLTSEREADYVGLYLAARAGYDINPTVDFWRDFGANYDDAPYVLRTHPNSRERSQNVLMGIEEINRKRAASEPLLPTGWNASAEPGS